MIYLPDVNIWIALTSNRHVHHQIVTAWLQTVNQDKLAFCRVSELGFLRLLTNSHVLGKDVLSPAQAWRVYDEWRTDDRVVFLSERADFGEQWRLLGQQITGGPNALDRCLPGRLCNSEQRNGRHVGPHIPASRNG
jgi:toxin-antitoxin system PIN domain toxin